MVAHHPDQSAQRFLKSSTLHPFSAQANTVTMEISMLKDVGDFLTLRSLIGIIVVTVATVAVKRRYFSSLSDIPGPFLASFSRLWQIITLIKGDSLNDFYNLHQKHGSFV